MVQSRARLKAASEDGFALMEAIVSAAVLMLVVLGVLAAMDAVGRTAGANKARTVAATLAEQDQERLRGMRTLDIDAMNIEPYTVDVAGVKYTVTSEAKWIREGRSGDVSCAVDEDSDAGSYMRITSTVTSPVTGAAVKPVVLSSLVTPHIGSTTQGTLTALVKSAAGLPVQGLTVTAANSSGTRQEPTNAAGCAVFSELDAGSYKVSLNQGGWVDPDGNTNPIKSATVSPGNVSTTEFAYDRVSSLVADVYTMRTPPTQVADRGSNVVAANTSLTALFRTFGPPNPPGTHTQTIQLTNLFPFVNSPYTVYGGACEAANPVNFVPNYYATHPDAIKSLAPGVPGGTVRVLEPAVNLAIKRANNPPGSLWNGSTNSRVYAYPKAAGCGPRIEMGRVVTGGKAEWPGLPFGTYDLCVYDGNRKISVANVQNTNPNGTPSVPAFIDSNSSTQGVCGNNTWNS